MPRLAGRSGRSEQQGGASGRTSSVDYLAPILAVANPLERARLARAVAHGADVLARESAREAAKTRSWEEIGKVLGMRKQAVYAWAHRRSRLAAAEELEEIARRLGYRTEGDL